MSLQVLQVLFCDMASCGTHRYGRLMSFEIVDDAVRDGWQVVTIPADANGPEFTSHYCPRHPIEAP
jgi:hypothetical protein